MMTKTRGVALAVAMLVATLASAPAGAAKPKKAKAASAATSSAKAAASKPAAATTPAAPAERKQDRAFNTLSMQFLGALWKIDPEAAIGVGKYDGAAKMTVPNDASRAQRLAFDKEWIDKLGKVDARQLSDKQRTDLAVLLNKVNAESWALTTLREFEWNAASYNIAEPIDLVLGTEYAAKPQRLRTLLKRIADAPAYYAAAQASLVNPTHEHMQLAVLRAPGTLAVLAELGKAAQDSILTPAEKNLYAARIADAGNAVVNYANYLSDLDKAQQASHSARSFRLGGALYEQKFAFENQATGTAEQLVQKAQAARDALLVRMDGLADELWTKTMGDAAKPAERIRKIGMVIDKLSNQHVARENFVTEIRRQIPLLQDFVIKNQLLTLDTKRPLIVRETPLYARGVAGASVNAPGPYRPQDKTYYNVTPLDGMTPAQAESSLREYNQWILQILNIHEAIPGHYAQLVYANRSPSIVKSLFGNDAMVEGWAVYGERMMLDAGYGDGAPEMALMYAKWHLRVVTNTILDYSVHVLGMQEAEAMDLLERQAFQTHTEAAEKWQRAQLSSVQLTSYFSGYTDIMELREQRKQQLGAKFVLKDFNEQFLSYGNAPVRMIRELMH